MFSADGSCRGGAGRSGGPAAGQLDVITSIYEREHRALVRFAGSRVRDNDIAEELVQEAFARLVRVASAGLMPERPRGWLYQVVANLAASEGRRRRVAMRHPGGPPPRDPPQPDSVVVGTEQARNLDACLRRLSPDGSAAVLLAAHGLTGAEIAGRLGRSELGTRALLCRSRARLRLLLTEVTAGASS